MKDEITPALTAAEWADALAHRCKGRAITDCDICFGQYERHAQAALVLHGQPFGFTRGDVDVIVDAIGNLYQIHGEWGVGAFDENDPEMTTLRSLKARIEALLPPESR